MGKMTPLAQLPAKDGMRPSPNLKMMVRVCGQIDRWGKRVWVAKCSASRCRFAAEHDTHNGAHRSAARHRRDKAYTKLHGAQASA